jgi:Domain of Unknown Function (DUF1080)
MRRSLLVFSLVLTSATVSAVEPPKGFTALFNGRDLDGWHGWAIHEKGGAPLELVKLAEDDRNAKFANWTDDANTHWKVENGELVNDGHGAYLATSKQYGDIELLIDYKTVPKADSGIYLRATPQVQIWDSNQVFDPKNPTRKPHLGSGGLFNNTPTAAGRDPLALADKPFGEWNRFRIIQVGERTTVYLNDKLVVNHARMENYWHKDRKLPLFKHGAILLQTHGGEIRWRNLFVREIAAKEANELLAKNSGEGFTSVFNGKDFTDWSGELANYTIDDGAIVCKPKKGGVIFTKEQYRDFVVTLEYKVPPGGNNGLAIRYPGKGRASADAMCEIQVLDDSDPKYKKLDPRQFNGSAYGIAAAQRGYDRALGEWNFEQVTVVGSTIQIELNGTRIMDTDLSTITEFKDKLPHPGKDRTEWHFGFCGHNDPVAFRNIRIRKLTTK